MKLWHTDIGKEEVMSKVIAVTSGKGGTGKSTVCAGLGYTLSKQGHRTLIIELDFGLRCLDIMFGMENDIKYDLGDVLNGKKPVLEAVSQVPMSSNLSILCAPKSLTSVTAEQIVDICRLIKKYYEYINAKGNINKGVFYSLLCIVFVLKISCSTLFFYIKVF